MKHNEDGRSAEAKVAAYLETCGFKIVERNWKTTRCEIDIVANKASCMYFVEVKYRSNEFQGDGFDYITMAKLRQMQFAADIWVQQHNWQGEYVLSGAAVSGPDFEIEFIEQI